MKNVRFRNEKEGTNGWSRWITPVMRGYLLKCCNCGLVHEMQFKTLLQENLPITHEHGSLVRGPHLKHGRVMFRARRRGKWKKPA